MNIRIRQVEELIREQIAFLIQAEIPEEMGMVTVTDTEVTADLKQAKVFITLVEKKHEQEVLQVLNKKSSFFQSMLGEKLAMRYTPRLSFLIDNSEGKINRIEELLGEIKE